jgi:hypothetical protein
VVTVIVVVGDVLKQSSFEAGVFDARNVLPTSCELLVYKSYSAGRTPGQESGLVRERSRKA